MLIIRRGYFDKNQYRLNNQVLITLILYQIAMICSEWIRFNLPCLAYKIFLCEIAIQI